MGKTYIRAKNFDADKPRAFKPLESAKPKYKLKVRDIVPTEDWGDDGMMEDDESIGDPYFWTPTTGGMVLPEKENQMMNNGGRTRAFVRRK